jgi:predicted lipoprotein with Yx(FWY)xxD motif
MRTKKILCLLTVLTAALTFLNVACKKTRKSDMPAPVVMGVQLTNNTKFGSIITDNLGQSLYFFADDANGTSACNGQCLTFWPIFYKDNLMIGAGLNATDFGVITRSDGLKQSTFRGWPLYYFKNDKSAGDTNGDGVDSTWFIGKTDYSVMIGHMQLVGDDGLKYKSNGTPGTEISKYITDPEGRTLYLFARDTYKTNTFSTNDPAHDAIWPIDSVKTINSIPSILDKTQFEMITVFGKSQLVYKGHPLYTFGKDASIRGNTKGVSFPLPGLGIWKVINDTTPPLTQ